jgi:hypothetical protein
MTRTARSIALCAVLGLAGAVALAGEPEDEAGCRAARDRALRSLALEAISIESAFDNDAAVAGAAEYDLAEARDALIADIDREREAVRRRYRQCVAESRPRPTK